MSRIQQQFDRRPAIPDAILYVVHRRARFAGHYPDPFRIGRDRLLVRLIKNAFGLELFDHLLESQLQRSDTGGHHRLNIELVPALRSVNVNIAFGNHRQAVFRLEFELGEVALPHNARQDGVFILEREIAMSAMVELEIRYLSGHRQPAGQIILQNLFDQRIDLTDRVNLGFLRYLLHGP
jgi:hypothetical protein